MDPREYTIVWIRERFGSELTKRVLVQCEYSMDQSILDVVTCVFDIGHLREKLGVKE